MLELTYYIYQCLVHILDLIKCLRTDMKVGQKTSQGGGGGRGGGDPHFHKGYSKVFYGKIIPTIGKTL
jgi:hypothetical protein